MRLKKEGFNLKKFVNQTNYNKNTICQYIYFFVYL